MTNTADTIPVENVTSTQTTLNAMLAIYNADGRMMGIRMATITLAPNGTDVVALDIDINGMGDVHHAKLFLTDEHTAPCTNVFELNY